MSRLHKDSLDKWIEHGFMLETRTVDLVGEIDEESAKQVIRSLHILATANQNPITLQINSPGGCWYNGMAIYDYIKALPVHVTAKVLGQAMSMASVILQACDERTAAPNATIMVHVGSDMFDGHAKDFERWGDYSKVIRQRMCAIYAERSGKSVSYWSRKCAHDFILTPKQALAEGLIDKIAE